MVQQVYLASATPPRLTIGTNLHGLLIFLEKYETYSDVGGTVELSKCIEASLLTSLKLLEPFEVRNNAELKRLLYKSYCPSDSTITLAYLRNEKCPYAESMTTFNKDKFFKYMKTFSMIMTVCSDRCPRSKDCMRVFLANTHPPELANYLRAKGVESETAETMMVCVPPMVRNFESCFAIMQANAPVRASVPRSTGAVAGGGGSATHAPRPKPAIVNVVAQPAPAPSAAHGAPTSAAVQPRRTWPPNMCLGCGHVTNPPHRREACPYRNCPGWCARGIPTAPIPLPTVSLLTDDDNNVCTVRGAVSSPNSVSSVEVDIGLDSMSAISIVSPNLVQRLIHECQATVHELELMKYIQPAGYATPVGYSTELQLRVSLGSSVSFTAMFAVLSIPVDIIVCWPDIKAHRLFGVLAEAAGVCLPKLTEIASEDSWSEDPVMSEVVPVEREALQNRIIGEFPAVFNENLPMEPAKVPAFTIELQNPQVLPDSSPPRRQPPVLRKFIADTVDDLLKNGFIVPSQSPVASPVVVVRAPGRDPRMCIDYRVVNAATLPLRQPLPNLKDILSRLRGFKLFCKLDLRKGYHQAMVDPASRYLTAFVTEQGQFEYVRVPFGLRNAPAYFQHVVTKHVLAGLIGSVCEVYIDDVITGANSIDELMSNVQLILKRFAHHGMIVHPQKWIFGVAQIEFLGHVVSAEGIQMSDHKKQGLMDLQAPKDKTALKSFIGLANYFRDFVPNFSARTALLSAPFVWNQELHGQFEDVRQAILYAPMLFHINYALPLVLRTDASQYGVGGVLLQLCHGVEQPISYVSKKLSSEARRWSTIDQEAFAIVFAIKSLRHYLLGHPFVVETDHHNLQYIAKFTEGRVGRWRLALQEYDFIVTHISGASNKVADALSRCCVVMTGDSQAVDLDGQAVEVSVQDPKQIISKFHDDSVGHNGIQPTVRKLGEAGYKWSTLRRDVVEFIHNCPICQKLRVTEKSDAPVEQHVIEAYEPFQEISLDSIVNLPPDENDNTCILVIIDNFTKFVELFAVHDVSAITAAHCLLSVVGRYGPIEIIRSDRGGQFVSDVFQNLTSLMGSKQLLTIGYRPQGNGIVERVNAEVIRHLSAIVHARRIKGVWSIGLPMVQRIINATMHSTTGYAPSTLLFGQRLHLDRAILTPFPLSEEVTVAPYVQKLHRFQCEAIKASQEYLSQQMDARVASTRGPFKQFHRGDYVVVRAHFDPNDDKFSFPWRGPYLVTESHNNLYHCMDLRTRKVHVFDVSTLRLFRVDDNTDPLSVAVLDVNEDIVDCIIGHEAGKKGKKSHKFKVQFMDGTISLLPYMEVRNLEALDKYLVSNPEIKKDLKI
jgi:hypothetical protein